MVRASQNLVEDQPTLVDLRERLLTYAQTATAVHQSSDRPAVRMWKDLLDRFDRHAPDIDRNNLVRADPMLLLGEVCILADDCAFDWGREIDER